MTKFRITQVRSTIDRKEPQKRTMVALGLTKMHRTVVHNDTPQIRGMIRAVSHLIEVEEINDADVVAKPDPVASESVDEKSDE